MHMERLLQLSPYINRPVEITPCNIYHIRMDNMFQKIPLYPMGKEIFHFSFSIQILHDTLFSMVSHWHQKLFFFLVDFDNHAYMKTWRRMSKDLIPFDDLDYFYFSKKKIKVVLCCLIILLCGFHLWIETSRSAFSSCFYYVSSWAILWAHQSKII